MYLSKLEILGFKSFAQKTKLNFDDGLTCIIGPNGSGKSNIVDAIRWVLGEQRVTSLRSEKMENVIFNGTKLRKPMGMSEVSMTIENNKNILKSEFDEIVIARRLYRSGESQYLINKVPVRLKDVINLFMDTGMGANSYSVIELKMVESILSENKNERRQLFEEAAGVVKYKTRRRSALRKLESTQIDLTRINDIVTEVENTVASLGRQVSKARRYLTLTEDLKKNDIDLAVFRYHKFKDLILPMENELTEASKEKEESSHQITLEEAILEDYGRQVIGFEQKVQNVNKELYDKDIAIRQLNQEDAIAQAKIEEMKKNQVRYLEEIDEFSQKSKILNENKETYNTELIELKDKQADLQEKFDKVAAEREEKSKIINSERAEIDLLNQKFREQLQNVSDKQELIKQKEYRINFDREQIDKLNNLGEEQKKEIQNLSEKAKAEGTKRKEAEEGLNQAQKNLDNLAETGVLLNLDIEKYQAEHNKLLSEFEKLRSRESFFNNIISSYEGHSQSTQYVMSNKQSFPGVHGPVAEIIEASEQDALLVETLLKEAVNYIVVDNVSSAQNLISRIKTENKGRITCIPLDRVNSIKSATGINSAELDFLLDRLKYPQVFTHLFRILLGDVAIADTLEQAISLADKYPGLRFITQNAELVNFNREISGGVEEKKETAIVGRKNKLAALRKEILKLEADLKALKEKVDSTNQQIEDNKIRQKEAREAITRQQQIFYENDNNLKQLNYQLETKQKQIEAADSQTLQLMQQIEKYHDEIKSLDSEMGNKKEELNMLEGETIRRTNDFERKNEDFQILLNEYQDVQLKLSNVQNQVVNRENDLKRISENLVELNNSINHRTNEIANIKQALIDFDNTFAERKISREKIWVERDEMDKQKQKLETELQQLKEKRHELENHIREYRRKHDNSLEKSKKLEIKINEYKYQAEAIRSSISKEYGTDVDAHLPNENLNEQETEELIDSLQNRIKNLGPVNPLAVSEHEKESERLEFLIDQRNDLQKAEASLLETIDKINKTARQQFNETFLKIKNNFENVFKSFFPNGRGTIVLEENKDPLEGDIDIEVTTKGRGLQTLSLLSGGEKTLTAISLLFAIYLVKPSPFCILDEVDAPLDDVNIRRFTEALSGFSNDTQFIVVTHNKRTMEAAKTMYGVTMEEEGISKLVSVKFN